MDIIFNQSSEIGIFQTELRKMEENPEVSSIMVLACDDNGYLPQSLDPILTSASKPLFGGVFPAILYNDQKYNQGFILAGFKEQVHPIILENMDQPEVDFDASLELELEQMAERKTIFLFVDGFAPRIGLLINSLFAYFGLEFNYIGGGGGSLSLVQKPCVITNKGLKQNCMVLAATDRISDIGVQHGWSSISGPFEVTKSEGNVLIELDYQPAFEVYRQHVDQHSGTTIGQENFFSIAKAYPFGINKLGTEKIVRDPISADANGSLLCVGEIEKGTFVDILNGNKDSLLNAAGSAMLSALNDAAPASKSLIFFIDCISRVLYLEDDFKEEIMTVYEKSDLPMIGALTFGEIANSGKDYLEFHNKTSVIASL